MLAFLLSRAGVATMVILAVVALFGVQEIRLMGAQHSLASLREADAAAARRAVERQKEARAIATTAAAETASQRVEIVTRTRTLIQKVTEYVPAHADADCVVPRGFVELHDAAAAGRVPGSAGGPVEAPSGVPLSAVASTLVANYGIAYDWRAEALGWRDWYVKERTAWDRK